MSNSDTRTESFHYIFNLFKHHSCKARNCLARCVPSSAFRTYNIFCKLLHYFFKVLLFFYKTLIQSVCVFHFIIQYGQHIKYIWNKKLCSEFQRIRLKLKLKKRHVFHKTFYGLRRDLFAMSKCTQPCTQRCALRVCASYVSVCAHSLRRAHIVVVA